MLESIDTDTPSGRMFLKIIGIFAEFERENLSARTKLGFERKVKEGYTLARTNFSYGYTREIGQKIQKIVPNEAKIVKEIFAMYTDENMTYHQIAKNLNQRRIKTKNNLNSWHPNTIKVILSNPNYNGKVRYSMDNEDKYFEVEGKHERIISEELYNLTQEKMKNVRSFSKTKRAKEDGYFYGVLTCEMCGNKFTTQRNALKTPNEKGEKVYAASYRCKGKQYFNSDITCKCPDISHDKVDKAFSEYIKRIGDFSKFDDIEIENDSSKENEILENITDCEKKINALLVQKKRVMERYAREDIEFEEYKELLTILNGDYESLENELNRLKNNIHIAVKTPKISNEDIIFNVRENWDILNNVEKMTFMQRFMKRIVINVEKERHNSSIISIKKIEFNLSSKFPLKNAKRENIKTYKRKNAGQEKTKHSKSL